MGIIKHVNIEKKDLNNLSFDIAFFEPTYFLWEPKISGVKIQKNKIIVDINEVEDKKKNKDSEIVYEYFRVPFLVLDIEKTLSLLDSLKK
jgi:hypothetical protein